MRVTCGPTITLRREQVEGVAGAGPDVQLGGDPVERRLVERRLAEGCEDRARELDRLQIGEGKRGPITTEIQRRYFACVKGEDQNHADWLTLAV